MKQSQELKAYKVKKVPNRDDKQCFTAKSRAKELYTNFLQTFSCTIMDNETYVLENFKQFPGQALYTAMRRNAIAEHFRTKKVSKLSMSMIDRPRLLLHYCRNSSNYTENQQIALGTSNHLQCIKIGVSVHKLGNTGTGRVRMQVNEEMGRNLLAWHSLVWKPTIICTSTNNHWEVKYVGEICGKVCFGKQNAHARTRL